MDSKRQKCEEIPGKDEDKDWEVSRGDKAYSAGQVDTETKTQPRATPLIRERRRRRDGGQNLLIKLSPLG